MKNQGKERTQAEGLKRKSRYQKGDVPKKTELRVYISREFCPLKPEGKMI